MHSASYKRSSTSSRFSHRKFSEVTMICTLVVFVAACAAVTAAAEPRLVSPRQSCPVTLPAQCTQQSIEYIRLLQGITSVIRTPETVNRLADTIGPFLETFCNSDCLEVVLRAYACAITNVNQLQNLTTDMLCSRQEDGTLCPVKIVQELNRTTTSSSTGNLLPLCLTGPTPTQLNCDTACQQSYTEVRNRLGCCGANWYGARSPNPGYRAFGNNFAVCNVTLGNVCTSGAAGLYLNVLLIAAVILLSMAMI